MVLASRATWNDEGNLKYESFPLHRGVARARHNKGTNSIVRTACYSIPKLSRIFPSRVHDNNKLGWLWKRQITPVIRVGRPALRWGQVLCEQLFILRPSFQERRHVGWKSVNCSRTQDDDTVKLFRPALLSPYFCEILISSGTLSWSDVASNFSRSGQLRDLSVTNPASYCVAWLEEQLVPCNRR